MNQRGKEWYQKEEVAQEYDQRRFERGGKVLDKREKEMILELVEPDKKRILDIATGTGRFAELLADEGGDVIGLDASSEMLRPRKATYVLGDALKLPFDSGSFDVSISIRFLHLLSADKIDDFIKEVSRITKNKFVFETLHPLSLRILYQWALPQNSSLYSNSFLKEKFEEIGIVKRVELHETLCIPYGIYQYLPRDIADELCQLDENIVDNHHWTASTVYWELYF